MATDILKSRGRFAAFLISIILAAAVRIPASGQGGELNTVLEQSVIPVGGVTMLRVTFDRGENIQPVKVPVIPGVDISYAGMQKSIQIINWKQSASVIISFALRGDKAGTYAIPPFVFQTALGKMSSRPVSLRVTPGAPGGPGGGGGEQALITTRLSLSKKSVYVGEPVIMNYYLLTAGVNAALEGFSKNPVTGGFVNQQLKAEPTEEPYVEGGVQYLKTRIASFALIPAGKGQFQVGGGAAVVSTDSPGQITFFGKALPFGSQRELAFGTAPVTVTALPGGAPASFQGDVGAFTVKAEFKEGDVKVYQEKRVAVTVSGTGNFISMTAPRLEKDLPDLKVIAEEGDGRYSVSDNGIAGEKRFNLTLIPTKAGSYDAGCVTLTFFNPGTGTYETAKSAPVTFRAVGDDSAGRMDFDREEERGIDFNPLIIGGVAVAVAAAIALFVFWERKRLRIITESVQPEAEQERKPREEDAAERLLAELEASYRNDDRNAFLLYADRLLSLAEKSMGAPETGEKERRFGQMKDRVYWFRYGGGKLERAAMEEILRDIPTLLQ